MEMPKFRNSNETFWMIFKQFVLCCTKLHPELGFLWRFLQYPLSIDWSLQFFLYFRCTRIHNPDFHPVEGIRCHSSSADEGFTSGSSPVNGTTSNVPMVLSPQSSETTHLVSSSSSSTSSRSGSGSPAPRRIPPAMECLARESTV